MANHNITIKTQSHRNTNLVVFMFATIEIPSCQSKEISHHVPPLISPQDPYFQSLSSPVHLYFLYIKFIYFIFLTCSWFEIKCPGIGISNWIPLELMLGKIFRKLSAAASAFKILQLNARKVFKNLRFSSFRRIIKGKQRLSHWIRRRDFTIIDKSNVSNTPTNQIPWQLATQSKWFGINQNFFIFLEFVLIYFQREKFQ
jgi:hypothetical protein